SITAEGVGEGLETNKCRSAVHVSVAHRSHRRRNIYDRYGSLHFVMAGLVEEVAEADDCGGLSREVHRQACAGVAEGTHHRIQLAASALQVGAGDCEVSGCACAGC